MPQCPQCTDDAPSSTSSGAAHDGHVVATPRRAGAATSQPPVGGCDPGSSLAAFSPHCVQNFVPTRSEAPQCAQLCRTVAASSPQPEQNRASAERFRAQRGHFRITTIW